MSEYRFFKCNVLGGFRLSDINKQIKQGEYFYIETHVAETSRAVQASLRERWMFEVNEKEASKHIDIPRVDKNIRGQGVSDKSIGFKGAVNKSTGLSIPNPGSINRNLESRQAEANNLTKMVPDPKKAEQIRERQNDSKPIIPDFKKAEKTTLERQNDSMNKKGASTDKELAGSMKDTEVATGPEFKKAAEKKIPEVVKEIEKEVTVTRDDSIQVLANDAMFDNSQVSVPNFDEKNDVKEEVKAVLGEKIVRKKRILRKRAETEVVENS